MKQLMMIWGLALSAMAGQVWSQTVADRLQVVDPYVRAVPPGQPNSASFLALRNTADAAHALVGAESPVAEVVELHTHIEKDGMLSMRQVERIELPAGQTVELRPGGFHVMLLGLKERLTPGEKVPVRLLFEDGSSLDIQAEVRKLNMGMRKMQQSH